MDLAAGKIRVKSWFDFVNARDVAEGSWEVKAEGQVVASGKLPELDIQPRQEKEYALALPRIAAQPGVEHWLNLSFALKADAAWAAKGHEIAWDQFALPVAAPARAFDASKAPKLDIAEEGEAVTLKGPVFSLRFNKREGVITSYRYKGVSLLERGPRPDFWRAATDNDTGGWKNVRERAGKDPSLNIKVWRDAGSLWEVKDAKVERVDQRTARLTVNADLPAVGASYAMIYTVYGTGDVVVECAYQPGSRKLAMLPRLGTELIAAPGLENIAWYGRGPVETHIDRQFERIGVYRSTVDKEWVNYSRPQENGNKTDVRWVALTNAQGVGLLAVGAPALSAGARHYTKEDMERAGYTFQMQRHPQVFLNLDWKQMGAGGIDSWSANAYPMAPYRIPSDQAYSYKYRLAPVEGDFSARTREKF